jgi:predicted outer membrane repeat protein
MNTLKNKPLISNMAYSCLLSLKIFHYPSERIKIMKIGIPVDAASLKASVSTSFGRTAYFLVVDLKDDTTLFIQNTASDSQGGAGIKAAQILADQNVEAVCTPQMGENAALVFSEAKIRLFKTNSSSISETIESYKTGSLISLDQTHSGNHSHG